MSAHVLLNLLTELRKINVRLAEHLSLFRSKFNQSKNTRAQIVDSIYHMTLKLLQYFVIFMLCKYGCCYVTLHKL